MDDTHGYGLSIGTGHTGGNFGRKCCSKVCQNVKNSRSWLEKNRHGTADYDLCSKFDFLAPGSHR